MEAPAGMTPRQHLERAYKALYYSDCFDMPGLDGKDPPYTTKEACNAIREAQALLLDSLRQMPMIQPPTPEGYWPGVCTNCGWKGASCDAAGGESIADTGDYSDVVCPVCGTVLEDDD